MLYVAFLPEYGLESKVSCGSFRAVSFIWKKSLTDETGTSVASPVSISPCLSAGDPRQ